VENLPALFREEAARRGLLDANRSPDLAEVFALVREMPYQRASDRQPQTLIREWRGTCSGKHYLLQALYKEMGYRSTVMACTTERPMGGEGLSPGLHRLWEQAGRRFVDVHNYLVLHLPEGDMVVDATWPQAARRFGLVSNAEFVRGQDQKIAFQPAQTWSLPEEGDPQEFKDRLLHEHFTPAELAFREAFILAFAELLQQQAGTG
jgi:hypothetical protein